MSRSEFIHNEDRFNSVWALLQCASEAACWLNETELKEEMDVIEAKNPKCGKDFKKFRGLRSKTSHGFPFMNPLRICEDIHPDGYITAILEVFKQELSLSQVKRIEDHIKNKRDYCNEMGAAFSEGFLKGSNPDFSQLLLDIDEVARENKENPQQAMSYLGSLQEDRTAGRESVAASLAVGRRK